MTRQASPDAGDGPRPDGERSDGGRPTRERPSDELPDGPARRNFVAAAAAVVVGGLAAFAPVAASVVALFDPLRRKGDAAEMVPVTRLSVLPTDGRPRKFAVTADRTDAWTTVRDTPIGAVYLRRSGERVEAFNVICPHAGCFVNLADDGTGFACPCHDSRFALDGSVSDPASPAPRGLDTLDVEIREGGEIWVRFQNFRTGRKEKTPVA